MNVILGEFQGLFRYIDRYIFVIFFTGMILEIDIQGW